MWNFSFLCCRCLKTWSRTTSNCRNARERLVNVIQKRKRKEKKKKKKKKKSGLDLNEVKKKLKIKESGLDGPVAEGVVEADEEVLLVGGEVPPLDVRPEVVDPPQPAALPAAEKPCNQPTPISSHHHHQPKNNDLNIR